MQKLRAERSLHPVAVSRGVIIHAVTDVVLTKPIKADPTMSDVLFFAVPATMYPINRRTFPPMMNHRRPKRSEFAPQTMKAMVTVMVYTGTYQACLVTSPS